MVELNSNKKKKGKKEQITSSQTITVFVIFVRARRDSLSRESNIVLQENRNRSVCHPSPISHNVMFFFFREYSTVKVQQVRLLYVVFPESAKRLQPAVNHLVFH